MRYLYPILLLFLFITCKKESDPAPLPNEVTEGLPASLLSFSIDDVPKENIRFVTLEQNGPLYNRIVVTLPKNYAHGDEMTVRLKLLENCIIRDMDGNEFNASNLKVNFSKANFFWLFVYNKSKDFILGNFYLYVDPSVPMTAPSTGKNYEETLDGDPMQIPLKIQNLGTAETISDSNKLATDVDILIKNKKTGTTTISSAGYYYYKTDYELLASIPAELDAGEYELTLQKQNRKVVIPDALILKYGKPVILNWPYTSASKDSVKSISYSGYNLLPEHQYTIELKNDFTEPQHLTFSPTSRLAIKLDIPSSFPHGNYEATIFVDGEKIPSYFAYNQNVFVVKKEARQPMILTLSNEKSAVSGEVTLYKAITTFKRSEPIIAYLRDGVRANMKLVFQNIATGKDYELPYIRDVTDTPEVISFAAFSIPAEIPGGKYQVRAKEGNRFSELYQRIVTIE